MKKLFCAVLIAQFLVCSSQTQTSYFKTYTTSVGQSAISVNTLSAKTYSFNYFVYKLFPDSNSGQMFASIRQKDVNGRNFTNKGYHLVLKANDTACCLLEDNKFELNVLKDFILLTGDKKSSRFNPRYGFEQFEFPSRIIEPNYFKNIGFTYNPALKTAEETLLSCVNLTDGNLKWSTNINGKYNWNGFFYLNDSVAVVAASGIHAINLNKGGLWSYSFATGLKSNKPLVYSPFNEQTWNRLFKTYNTLEGDAVITDLCSNVLVLDSMLIMAGNNKIVAVGKDGSLKWEVDLKEKDLAKSILYETAGNIVLINLGIAKYNDNFIHYGKPSVLAFSKYGNQLALNYDAELLQNILDVETYRNTKYLANKNQILQVAEDMKVQIWIDLNESKFGKFLEFINGDDYYVEKEGFFVPLNFINDNVIYFKTDHGKIFGLNKNQIEYEYHFTELYKLENKFKGKLLVKQKGKTLLLSQNFEKLAEFGAFETSLFFNNKLYFTEGHLIHIFDMNNLK